MAFGELRLRDQRHRRGVSPLEVRDTDLDVYATQPVYLVFDGRGWRGIIYHPLEYLRPRPRARLMSRLRRPYTLDESLLAHAEEVLGRTVL